MIRRRRKIVLWTAGVLAALALGMLILAVGSVRRSARRAEEFTRQHADAPRQAEALTARVSRSLRPRRESGGTTATVANKVIRRDIAPLVGEYHKLSEEYRKRGIWFYRIEPQLHDGVGAMMLVLPAAEFVKPGAASRLEESPALRQRILGEVEAQMGGPRYHPAQPLPRNALTSGPLAARFALALDQTRDILAGEWDELATPTKATRDDAAFVRLGVLALEREARHGRTRDAGRLLEGLARAAIALHLRNYPYGIPNQEIQQAILRLARQGVLDEAALARLERVLAAGRLSDAEVACLRAAFVMTRANTFKEALAREQAGGKAGFMDKFFKVPAEKWAANNYLAALAAWGAGDGPAFDEALANPFSLTFIMPKIQSGECPGHQAGFGGESTANDALDTTRLIVAAERYRLARGEYPVKIEDLRPGYLDATFDARAGGFWGVARLEPKSGDGATAKSVARPVFYHAWRTPLSVVRFCTLSAGFDDLRTVDKIGMVGGNRHPWLHKLGLGNESRMLDLWSNRVVEAVVVRVVWPQLEEMKWEWF